jgi:hypothetical protein
MTGWAYQRVYMIFDPCGRFPREQTTTTNLTSALVFGVVQAKQDREAVPITGGKGKDRGNPHESNIDLVEHGENIRPSPTERIGPSRDGRINKEVERQVKRRDREPIE